MEVREIDAPPVQRSSSVLAMTLPCVHSPVMQALWKRAKRAAQSDITLLITGESGTGKSRLARAIHEESPRYRKGADNGFHEVMIAGLPKELVETELFGYVRGAYTSARDSRAGYIEKADDGTLLLDEIGDVPVECQVKLLDVLENRRVTRVGQNARRGVDVRFIFATQFDLAALVKAGRFRNDLYYRIAVEQIHLPPLRERPTEIIPLAEYYLAKSGHTLSPEVKGLMFGYSWPGNIRELKNMIERAVAFADNAELTPADFSTLVRA